MSILNAAREYLAQGISVIPTKGKVPAVKWTNYQKRFATADESEEWFSDGMHNIAIVTGELSGLAVIDFDTEEAFQNAKRRGLPDGPMVKTGRGCHLYCRHTPGIRNFQKRDDLPGVDLRAEGGLVVAPPSIHNNGKHYEWMVPLTSMLNDIPDWLLVKKQAEKTPIKDLYSGAQPGSRNDSLTRLVGSWVATGGSLTDVLGQALTWNASIKPPLSYAEVERTVKSIFDTHNRNNASIPWPTLSREALPGVVGDFVDAACKNSEADPAAILATFLTWLGIQFGTSVYLMIGDTRHHARINSVIVGETSKARKGTSAGPIRAVIKQTIDACRISPGPLSSGEGIVYNVRDEDRKFVVDRKTGDGHWEVTDPGIEDKRLFVLDEEFAAALQCTKREGNTLSAVIRTLYDSGDCEPLTKGNPIKATGAHVGISTHITVGELTKLLTATEQINGFGNRFLWVLAKRQKIVPFPEGIPQKIIGELTTHIGATVEHAHQVGQFLLSTKAKILWGNRYYDLSNATPGRAGQLVSRGEVMVLRLALIYAIIAKHDAIETDDLIAGLAFWDYCHQSALFLFDGKEDAPKLAKRILELLADGDMTKTEMHNALNRNIKADELDQITEYLQNVGSITSATITSEGAKKPTTVFSLAPVRSYELDELKREKDNDLAINSLSSLISSSHHGNVEITSRTSERAGTAGHPIPELEW